jgi:prepilin-type N-terminal cleavage/methylation domain-containing protein
MHPLHHIRRRGMTLLELMLALSITAMVSTAIAGMLNAMTTGVVTRRDSRGVMVRATTAQTRLGAYITPARSVLASNGGNVVLWYEDSRESDTVHASEVRWIRFDAATQGIDVLYVAFPDAWTDIACDLADKEHAANSNWDAVLAGYQAMNLVASMRVVDGLSDAAVTLNDVDALEARVVSHDLDFAVQGGSQRVRMASAVMFHQQPAR